MVKGLWEGINDQVSWVLNKIKGFGKSIVKGIKSIFGIHSPSTVMRDQVGKFLAEGVGVGFEDELDNVYNDMQKAIDIETGKMSANVQTSGTYQMAMAGLPTFSLKDNSTNTTQLVVNGKILAETVNTENRNRGGKSIMQDYLIKIGNTKLRYILRSGYEIKENQEIVLASLTMADGTERRNIAEKRKTSIAITFSQIDGQTLESYSNLWINDFEATYWSKDDREYKTAIFRVSDKPSNAMLYSGNEIYDEFTVEMESV